MICVKYDIVTSIELVETKLCLWDKTDEGNKKIKFFARRVGKKYMKKLVRI